LTDFPRHDALPRKAAGVAVRRSGAQYGFFQFSDLSAQVMEIAAVPMKVVLPCLELSVRLSYCISKERVWPHG
jgi:hypothetical protein